MFVFFVGFFWAASRLGKHCLVFLCGRNLRWNGILPRDGEFIRPRDHVLLLLPRCGRTSLPEVPLVEEVHDSHSARMYSVLLFSFSFSCNLFFTIFFCPFFNVIFFYLYFFLFLFFFSFPILFWSLLCLPLSLS